MRKDVGLQSLRGEEIRVVAVGGDEEQCLPPLAGCGCKFVEAPTSKGSGFVETVFRVHFLRYTCAV